MSGIYLSVVIPAYNEEYRLPKTLEQAFNFLQSQEYTYEVLVVENGSQDRTLQVANEFARLHPQFTVLKESGRGKGMAVKRGMLQAKGEFCFMCDADLSMPITELNRFLPPQACDYDIAIASREAPGAVRYNEPLYRHLGGRAINTVVRMMALPGLHDTQCGFKCFRRPVARDIFPYQTLTGWSFDIEILYIARQRGYKIIEIPIPWYYNPESKISATRDALRMLNDILTIRRNASRGFYDRSAESPRVV